MGMSNSLYAPESDQDAEKTSQEPQQTLSDIVKTTRRRRLVRLIANRFRSSPSDKSGQPTKKLAVEGGVVEGGTQAVPIQPRQDAAMGSPPIDKIVEDHVTEAEAQVVPEQPKQHVATDTPPTDRVVDGDVVKDGAQAVPEQPQQHAATDTPPTDRVVDGDVVKDGAQAVPEQPQQHAATDTPPTDRVVDGDAVKDEAQAVSNQPEQDEAQVVAEQQKQDSAVDTPPIDKVLDVPEDFLRDLRAVLDKGQVSRDTPLELTKELEAKLAWYSEEKVKEYDALRQQGTLHEASLGFDFACTTKASEDEIKANEELQKLKMNDIERFYGTAPAKYGYAGQEHKPYYGDHFLSNVDLIEQTQLFALCRAMPKGAHLHIHFNANLLPSVLLGIAKGMDRMFIWSSTSLHRSEAFDSCRIQFSIMNEAAVEERGTGNLFDPNYVPPNYTGEERRVMQFQQFLKAYPGGEDAALNWLQSKLVFQEEEAHNVLQTQQGSVCFDHRCPAS
jgi:adenosine deaminase CECR1